LQFPDGLSLERGSEKQNCMIIHNLIIDNDDGELPDYLFRSKSHVVEFVVIDEEMEELNEFCVICDEAAIARVKDVRELRVIDAESGETDEEWTDFMQHCDHLRWSHVQEVMVAGMILSMLFAFTEKSLKWLCQRMGPPGWDVGREKFRGPKIDTYVRFLQQKCGLDISMTPEFAAVSRLARPLRNHFTHGDWQAFTENLGTVDLSKAFNAASTQFRAIEDAYMALQERGSQS
jgi:hypothetical protein